jgi:hypothetical protein
MTSTHRRADRAHKHFTLEEADAMLPLVRAIVRDIVKLAHDLDSRRQRIAPLMAARNADAKPDRGDLYDEELEDVKQRLDQDKHRLQALRDELVELGIRLADPLAGLVEFPTRLGDRGGWLCWKPEHEEIRYWRPERSKTWRRLPETVGTATGEDRAAGDDPDLADNT